MPGAYGIDELGNAIFAIDESSIYYPDSNERYKYELKGDTILLIQDERQPEHVIVKNLTQEYIVLHYCDYEITDTLVRRDANTGDEVAELNQTKIHFDHFLEKLSSDSVFQLTQIVFPFKTKSYDIEDNVEESVIELDQWVHLDFRYNPEYAFREIDAYEQEIEVFSDSCIVSLKGIDNGIWIDYVFEKEEGDWKLYKFIDYSN